MSILVELVKQDFGITRVGERWWRSEIHSSLVVDSDKDKFYFNSRGIKGGPLEYLTQVRGLPNRTAEEFVRRSFTGTELNARGYPLQVRFDKLVDLFYNAGKSFREYWYKRGLNDTIIDRYRLGFNDDWFLIPIYDNGKFINFQCRKDDPKKIKLWYRDDDFKPVLFNSDIIKFVGTIYITEGMVDCLLLNQLGFPCVCTTNGSLSWNSGWIKFFSGIKDIYYIADNDKAGIHAAKDVAKSLGTSRVHILRFKDLPDKAGAVDYFKSGGTVEEFKLFLKEKTAFEYEMSSI